MVEQKTLPKHWQIKKLGEVCKLINGYAFKSSDYENHGIPVIRISDINGGFVTTNKAVRVSANKEYENYLIENQNILIAMSGATTGKFGIYSSSEKSYQNQRVGKFKVLDASILDNRFLLLQLHSLKRQIEADAYGGAQPNISSGKIEQMQIILPPLLEQQAIVSKIEELLSELENGNQQLVTARKQLKVYRQSLLKWAFEGRLNYDSDNLYADHDIKKEIQNNHVNHTNQKNHCSDNLPKGWRIVELKSVVDKISDGPFGSNLKSDDYTNQGIRVIRLENIGEMEFRNEYQTFVSLEKYETIKNHTVGPGDIIFSSFITDTIRSVVLPGYIDKAVNKADCFLVRVAESKINRSFLAYYFSTKAMRNQLVVQIHGATRPRINTTQLKSSLIPLPSLEEQQLIVNELESRLTVCANIEETITRSLQQAETLRQSILKKAFEGKLVTVADSTEAGLI